MSSKLQICNLALSHLGMRAIANFTDDNPSVTACNNSYDAARDDTFSESAWPFATVREALVLSSETVLGWDYVYTYPANAATVWYVFDEATVDSKWEQEFEALYVSASNKRVLCSDLVDAYAEYTYKITDTTLFSPKFVMALSYRLAAAMAHTLIGSADVGLKMTELYNNVISEAKRLSFNEKIKKPSQTSSYQNSRG